jgi:hypothetical protein
VLLTAFQPALAQEIEFYQRVNGEPRSSPLGALRRFLPKFYGTLTLQGLAGEDGAVEEVEEQGSEVRHELYMTRCSSEC